MKKSQFERLNSHYQKIWERLFSDSVPADFTYSEARTLLVGGLGFQESNKGKTSGSRVKFFRPEEDKNKQEVVLLHKPHPGDVMKKSSVKGLREQLLALYEKAK